MKAILLNSINGSLSTDCLPYQYKISRRTAWEQFKGFPREDAAKAYVYIVNQFKDSLSGEKGGNDNSDQKSQLGPAMSMFR